MVTQLQADMAERDQALLSNDLEIAGYPESPNENCVHVVLTVANKVGVELNVKDIVSANRAGPARTASADNMPPRTRPLIVRLTHRATRDALLQAARTRRNLNTEGLKLSGPIRSLYINERLTKNNRLIFQKARALGRDMRFKYIWTREGKIFARQEHGKPRHRIRNETDLLNIFGKAEV